MLVQETRVILVSFSKPCVDLFTTGAIRAHRQRGQRVVVRGSGRPRGPPADAPVLRESVHPAEPAAPAGRRRGGRGREICRGDDCGRVRLPAAQRDEHVAGRGEVEHDDGAVGQPGPARSKVRAGQKGK